MANKKLIAARVQKFLSQKDNCTSQSLLGKTGVVLMTTPLTPEVP